MTTPDEPPVPVPPPAILYHATAWTSLGDVMAAGLRPADSAHVHLTADAATAVALGTGYGCSFVLAVESGAMHAEGHEFYPAPDGGWLTSQVPPAFLQPLDLDGRV
ncbi:MAG: RNA 2'-phosphotransferase [Acidimicrobiia bacterium]